jgi:hypothetical protein
MKNKIFYKNLLPAAAFCAMLMPGFTSCIGDLDTIPLDREELVPSVVFGPDEDAYTESLAKIYAGLAIGGNAGGDNSQDVDGIDGGSQASFLRVLWNMQELASDIAHCCWDDPGIPDFNHLSWGASSPWIKGSYYRLYYQIGVANAFLRETTDDLLTERGCSDQVKATVKAYRAEARFLRALMYKYALDLYRNVPFIDETSLVGSVSPQQIMAPDLFNYIEKELLDAEADMLPATVGYNQDYGHANKAAVWAALSRLYLNAEAYVGQNKYTECITYANKVITAGYTLEPIYADMFKADNDHSPEMILPVRYEGDDTMTWGGMTALLCWGSADYQTETNAKAAWQGVRAKSSLYNLFMKESDSDEDTRLAMLRTDGTTSIEITDETIFKNQGIPVTKFSNVNKDGTLPASAEAWTDYPLFRLGEVYLNLAEAVLRGGEGATRSDALTYVNDLRRRAYTNKTAAPVGDGDLTLDFLLDERARELFYEAQRRTDLVRFGKYTSADYLWPWKGGAAAGKAVADYYQVYPLPSDDIGANLNLKQNEGYY